MFDWVHAGIQHLQSITALIVVAVIGFMWLLGYLIQKLVHHGHMAPSAAVRIIGTVAAVFGILTGSVAVMIMLMIFWPDGSNWIVNDYLAKTTIWQAEFQQWLASQVGDSRMSTTIGLVLKSLQFGGMFLGAVLSHVANMLFSILMKKSFHEERCLVEKLSERHPAIARVVRAAMTGEPLTPTQAEKPRYPAPLPRKSGDA